MKLSRRDLMAGLGAQAVHVKAGKAFAQQRLIMNDASRLNPTPLLRHWHVRSTEADFVAMLRRELKEAATASRPVAIGAARHSMGGQSLIHNGVAMTFDIDQCELDRAAKGRVPPSGVAGRGVTAVSGRAGSVRLAPRAA